MPFTKGDPNAGRPKGSENKETKRLREWVGKLLDGYQDQVYDDLGKLNPKDRIAAVSNLLEYCLPKLQRTELVDGDGQSLTITVRTIDGAKDRP